MHSPVIIIIIIIIIIIVVVVTPIPLKIQLPLTLTFKGSLKVKSNMVPFQNFYRRGITHTSYGSSPCCRGSQRNQTNMRDIYPLRVAPPFACTISVDQHCCKRRATGDRKLDTYGDHLATQV